MTSAPASRKNRTTGTSRGKPPRRLSVSRPTFPRGRSAPDPELAEILALARRRLDGLSEYFRPDRPGESVAAAHIRDLLDGAIARLEVRA